MTIQEVHEREIQLWLRLDQAYKRANHDAKRHTGRELEALHDVLHELAEKYQIPADQGLKPVVVSWHPALADYACELGLVRRQDMPLRVLSHARESDVSGKYVIGKLPTHLAVKALLVADIPLIVPPHMKGQELSLEDIRRYSRPVNFYHTRQLR